jgi:predicted kinase
MDETRLLLTCGLPGAGKTTLARQLAANRGAVRLTSDDWIIAVGSNPWEEAARVATEQELWRLAQEILRLGTSVVLEYGLWGRDERDAFRSAARDLGVGVELHYLDVSTEELWRRIDERNAEPPWTNYPITRAHLEEWTASFQAPDAAELAFFDPPPASD